MMPVSPNGRDPFNKDSCDQDLFSIFVRVYIEDTDAGGVVFYANYLRYLERARTEFIRSLGFQRVIQLEEGISYVVHSLNIHYRKPARLDDELQVFACVTELGKTFILFEQQVIKADTGELLVKAQVKVACVDAETLKPRRLLPTLIEALNGKS
jgi:tol-pal system-associated acyl-CoA thioesterase